MTLIGVISDTHGLLRGEVKELFKDCSMILHAGDLGTESVLEELRKFKPTVAVRGNVDYWAQSLKVTENVEVQDKKILILHNIGELAQEINHTDIIIYGHSHKASVKKENGVLFFNPGSAGPQRFRLPITAGILKIDGGNVEAEIVALKNS